DVLSGMRLSLALKHHGSLMTVPQLELSLRCNSCWHAKQSSVIYLLTIKGHPASLKMGFNFPAEKSINASVRSVTLLTVLGMRLTASW
ncbi:hypothetical protein Tco_0587158, partial [Tanacetum coccineum]